MITKRHAKPRHLLLACRQRDGHYPQHRRRTLCGTNNLFSSGDGVKFVHHGNKGSGATGVVLVAGNKEDVTCLRCVAAMGKK